jgi:NADPH-dependent 2,4-dienoyl-CoA reductase/sulfur reductase-like enzyme
MTVQHLSNGYTTSNRTVCDDVDDTQAGHRPVVILGAGPAGLIVAMSLVCRGPHAARGRVCHH